MTAFPTAASSTTFSGSNRDLFSPQEIQSLMRGEFDRAQRYGFPIVCMMVAVDRIESLADLYGVESKTEIMASVSDLLKTVTRASDFMGCMIDDRVLAIFPHTSPEVASTLARRLLERARALRFQDHGRRIGITLSIGVSHNQLEADLTFETLLRVAQDGLEVADSGGGDRFVQTDVYQLYAKNAPEAPAVSAPLPAAEAAPPAPAPAPAPVAPPVEPAAPQTHSQAPKADLPSLMDAGLEGTFVAKFQALLDATHDRALAEKLRNEFLNMALQNLAKERQQAMGAESSEERNEYVDKLERRISKLNDQLGLTEEELRRVMAMKNIDPGLSSIYRTVQGLSPDDGQKDLKKEMMKQIFDANVEMQDSFRRGA